MSTTTDLLRRLSEIGASIRPAGNDLILRAGKRPVPADLVRRLRAEKTEVLAALAPAPQTADAAWWRREFTIRTIHWAVGSRTTHEAERLAFNELVIKWHRQQGESAQEWQCAGCGEPIGGLPSLDFRDGNRIHLDDGHGLDCLIAYGERWRGAATRALSEMGLRPPAEDAFS